MTTTLIVPRRARGTHRLIETAAQSNQRAKEVTIAHHAMRHDFGHTFTIVIVVKGAVTTVTGVTITAPRGC